MAKAPSPPVRITELLKEWKAGHDGALEQLMPLVHDELRRLARRHMGRERPGHTLQPTALVNEAYLRLLEIKEIRWQDRDHFFAVAARLMRRILVDSARARRAQKRGDGVIPVSLDDLAIPAVELDADHSLLELEKALLKLEAMDAR